MRDAPNRHLADKTKVDVRVNHPTWTPVPLGTHLATSAGQHQRLCQGSLATSVLIHPGASLLPRPARLFVSAGSQRPPRSARQQEPLDTEPSRTGGSFLCSSQETVTVELAGRPRLFYCFSFDVSLNSPSHLRDGTINLIKFLSPCKNVYMYAHLGNTLLITRLLNMDSELLLLLLFFFFFFKEHIYIVISLSSTDCL